MSTMPALGTDHELRRRPGLVRRLLRVLPAWHARRRQRLDLGDLDDRLLGDIGLTREEARRECAKRFWR